MKHTCGVFTSSKHKNRRCCHDGVVYVIVGVMLIKQKKKEKANFLASHLGKLWFLE